VSDGLPHDAKYRSPGEWQRATGIHSRRLLRAIHAGELEALRPSPGGTFLISPIAFGKWLRESRFQPRDTARQRAQEWLAEG